MTPFLQQKPKQQYHIFSQVWNDVDDAGVSPDSLLEGAARGFDGLWGDHGGGPVGHTGQGLRAGPGRGPDVRASAVQIARTLGEEGGYRMMGVDRVVGGCGRLTGVE